jgi:hypothetical protein
MSMSPIWGSLSQQTTHGLKIGCRFRLMMKRSSTAVSIIAILLASTLTSGCLGLAAQREVMETWREPPLTIEKEETFGWDHTFYSSGLEAADPYEREELIQFDESVTMLVINFRAQFPWSSQIEEVIGNQTNELRYVEVRLYEPGVKEAGGDPFWEIEASSDYPQTRFSIGNGTFVEGKWTFEVEARGYGITAPIEQLSFHDHFDVYLTITRPCVRFDEVHESGECTYLTELD